ncbi:MAG: hypothetical protein L0Z50_28200 [Verrucomicrobiales bacterium]|nr:hypothetical protein [Verrucomicrobiales bacterium]
MSTSPPDSLAWFCVRSQPKHEQIAAARLRQVVNVEVFNPRLRLRRRTRRGPVWMIEPLFPCYLFARFELARQLDAVRFASGVREVVAFGQRVPAVPDDVIEALRAEMGGELLERSLVDLAPGEEVTVASGPLRGLVGTVRQVLTPAQRVRVLLEMLGRETCVELNAVDVVPLRGVWSPAFRRSGVGPPEGGQRTAVEDCLR